MSSGQPKGGSQVIKRLNARKDDDLKRIEHLLERGYRITHLAAFDTDTTLILILDVPITFLGD